MTKREESEKPPKERNKARSAKAKPPASSVEKNQAPHPAKAAKPRIFLAADEGATGTVSKAAAKAGDKDMPRRARRRKRVRLGDAMRKVGLDERAIAENYAGVVEKLTTGQNKPIAGAEKLLVDVLKECTRVLEPPVRAGVGDAPVTVHLSHNVPRPLREAAIEAPHATAQSDEINAATEGAAEADPAGMEPS
ncbi:MAG: hypothetical protein ACRD4Q_04780 [Candidatus Acidiferrales bacterium]